MRASELHSHAWRVERKAHLIEKAKKEKEETLRKERERCVRLERARIERLLEEATALRLANDLRAYVGAVGAANAASPEPVPKHQMEAWTAWALAQAERIDPVRSKAFLIPVEDPGEEQLSRNGATHSGARGSIAAMAAASEPPWHPNRWYTRLSRG